METIEEGAEENPGFFWRGKANMTHQKAGFTPFLLQDNELHQLIPQNTNEIGTARYSLYAPQDNLL